MNGSHPITEAVGIFISITLLLLIYAWSDNALSWDNIVLQQAEFKKFLTYNPYKKTAQPLKVVKRDTIPQTDTTKQKILLIGDSMVQELELIFAPICANNHHQFRSIAIQSTSIQTYAQSDTLEKMIKEFEPSLVIIVLGSNELTIPDIESRRPYVNKILQVIGERKVIWIGPPNWRKDTGMNDLLAEIMGEDRFFRSANLKFQRKTDGIHPTYEASVMWSDSIFHWIEHKSRYRIRFDLSKKEDSLAKVYLKEAMSPIIKGRIKYQLRNMNHSKRDSFTRTEPVSIPVISDSLSKINSQ
jgi:hypothetical protein